jgi:hypothetical protein
MGTWRFALAAALAVAGGVMVSAVRAAPPAPEVVAMALPSALQAKAAAGSERLIRMQPMASTSAGETHAFLAVSSQSFGQGGTPYHFSGQMRTVKQLRAAAPNAWEVGWLVWNYADNDHLYYFVLKPNGWEIGKRDPRYVVPGVNDGQKIMATGESMKLALGRWYQFDIKVKGAEAEIFVDGKLLTKFRDTDSDPLPAGRVGLYGEDALCEWKQITAPVADSFEMEPVQAFADGSQLTNWRVVFLGYGSGGIVAR